MIANKIANLGNYLLPWIALAVLYACTEEKKDMKVLEETTVNEDELAYRPGYHFSPKANWMNDPNGMFFLEGTYHLFFQYYPDDNVWGPMHWGHATSKDMIDWEEQPIALYPDSLGYIFSGSAVVDINNTSGFGSEENPAVVAMFTYHDPVGAENDAIDFQYQGIAYSLDKGKSWTKYEGNPVIPNPGIRDFRDPKVVWDEERGQWIMVLAAEDKTMIYSSPNLKEWKYLSDFGANIGAHGGVWECPDFFPMRVENSEETKWVLLQSLNPGSFNGGSGTQYFVGDFDGENFILDEVFMNQLETQGAQWLDFGRDNYAGVTWSNIPESDGRKLFIGWMSNWDYAQEVPTTTWRSAMTLPRELVLKESPQGYQVHSRVVSEFTRYKKLIKEIPEISFAPGGESTIATSEETQTRELLLEFELSEMDKQGIDVYFRTGEDEHVILSYSPAIKSFILDRAESGKTNFSEGFVNVVRDGKMNVFSRAPYTPREQTKVEVYMDKMSIEVFVDDGALVITEIFFPEEREDLSITMRSLEEGVIKNIKVSSINSPE